MSYPYFDQVQRAYNDLKAEGKIKPRSTPEDVEHDKGLLTQRAGYYSHQRDPLIGVLEKSSGNQYMGYSVDILIQTDGTFWDIATDNGVEALPVNGGPSFDATLIPRWRQPTKELAQLPEDGGGDGGTVTPPPSDDVATQLAALTDAVQALQLVVTQQGEMVYHMATQTWHGSCKMGLDMQFGIACPPMPEK